MWRDVRFWAAIFAAPLYWLAVLLPNPHGWHPYWPQQAPLAFLLVVIAYPVLEEIVFRGWLQESLRRHIPWQVPGPVSSANLFTSIVFAALHVIINSNPVSAWVFFPSLVFGYCKDRYRTLTAPIILHIFYNAGYFLLLQAHR